MTARAVEDERTSARGPEPRLPLDEQEFARRVRRVAVTAAVTAFLLLAVLWALRELAELLVLVVFSLFCGFALEPAVNRMARRGWSRGHATLAVYAVLAAVFGAFGTLLGAVVVQQVSELARELPDYTSRVALLLESRLGIDLSASDVARTASRASDLTGSLLGGALGFGATVLGLLFSVLTVLTLTFYFAMDGPRMRRALCGLLSPVHQRSVLRALDLAIDRTAGYVYYRGTLAALSAVVHSVALVVLDVPFAVSLGLWVGLVSQFVPAVGTYLAGVLPVGIALVESPRTSLLVLGVIVVYQQVENYVVSPPLSAHTMSVHPATGFVAAVAGIALVGPLGALLALPLVATVQAFLSEYLVRHDVVDDVLLDDGPRSAGSVRARPG